MYVPEKNYRNTFSMKKLSIEGRCNQ